MKERAKKERGKSHNSGPTLWNSFPLSVRDPCDTDSDSVLCAFADCVILQSTRITSIAPT